jgi:hypothetical protein
MPAATGVVVERVEVRHRPLGRLGGRPVLRSRVAGDRQSGQQRQPLGVLHAPRAIGLAERQQPAPGVVGRHGLARLAQPLTELVVGVRDERGQQLVTTGEVAVERGSGHPHLARDVGEGDGGRPVAAHELERRRLDLLDGRGSGELARVAVVMPRPVLWLCICCETSSLLLRVLTRLRHVATVTSHNEHEGA